MGLIYKIQNKQNCKIYIGQTKRSLEWRLNNPFCGHFVHAFEKHTNKTKQKISESLKGKNIGENHPMYGKHLSKEHKQKLSEKLSGENHPMYGKKGILSPNYGKSFTEEHKKKISEKMSGKNNPSSKSVYVIELDMTFDTITECAKYLNCTNTNISNVLRGKSKTAKGYHIIYAECNKKYLDFVRYK